jgi:hypothetical protein
MAKSFKPHVIERIFNQRYNDITGELTNPVITTNDIEEAKHWCLENLRINIKLGKNNFNFMKDIVRGQSANTLWPESVLKKGFVGEQCTGKSAIFKFVRIEDGDTDFFQEDFNPSETTSQIPLQSLSLPIASRELGRRDESWLLQVAVNLRALETHFSVAKEHERQLPILELSHLQMDIKLRRTQIDALFRAHCGDLGAKEDGGTLLTVEAKQTNQRILTEQIARQVHATFAATRASVVIPLAIKAIKGQGIFVVEFEAVRREALDSFHKPIFYRDSMINLLPSVPGI